MTDDIYTEKLGRFKEDENPEVILLIADDPDLIKIIIAWTNTAVRKTERPTKFCADSSHEVWEWLWKNAKYSRTEVIEKSGVSGYGFDAKFQILVGNRVI